MSCRRVGAGAGGVGRGVCGASGAAGPMGWGVHGDVDRGDGGRQAGPAVVAVEVAGGGAFDLAGAVAGPAGGQQRGQDGAADDAGQVGLRMAGSGQIPPAAVSWSRAASRAVVKLARSGSVPGRVSTAVTMAMRSSW